MKCSVEEFKKNYKLVKEGKLQNVIAAKACNYTPERFSILRKRYEKEGDKLFIHGHCGKKAYNAVSDETRRFVVEQYLKENDYETNPINFAYWRDELEEIYDIKLSYRTVYDILTAAGIESPEKHKVDRKPVKRIRFRRKHFGELIQWDATPFQWFLWAGDTRYYSLHGALDDSTSTFVGMYMTEFECRYGYIECRRQVLKNYGIELEDYSDKSPVFHNNYKEQTTLTIEEQLAGTEKKKPLWEVMNSELNVKLHLAQSPQAKGKIERAWETVQGRLVNELKKRGIKTIEGANRYIQNEFINYYNFHFAKTPVSNIPVFRAIPKEMNLDNILCVKEKRTILKNGCISFKGLKLKVVGIERYGIVGELCINERGLWYLYKDKNYQVEVMSGLHELSATAPQVLENIIYDYMYKEIHEHAA